MVLEDTEYESMIYIEWLGTACFWLCGLPQVIKCIIDGNAKSISLLFLLLWLTGEICYTVAIAYHYGIVPWMLSNYAINIMFLIILLRYKFK